MSNAKWKIVPVEAIADHGCIDGSGVLVAANVPDDWAGRTVLVMVKP